MSRRLPMFPLGTVLFPGAVLPLHVFEPRYRALTGWCLEHDGRFGVVLIARGSEVGGGDVRFDVGTQARITEAAALPDGRWLLAVEGEERIRVREWLDEDPYPRADVDDLVDDLDETTGDAASAAEARRQIVDRARLALELLSALGEAPPGAAAAADGLASDPASAAWQVAALGLLGPADGQRLLEAADLPARLDLLGRLLDDAVTLLALRAGER